MAAAIASDRLELEQVHVGQFLGPTHDVDVGVVEAGRDQAAIGIHHLGRRVPSTRAGPRPGVRSRRSARP